MFEYDYVNHLPYFIKMVGDNVVRKTAQASMPETIQFMEKICNFLIAHPVPTIVPVYDFQYHGRQEDGNHHYTYDMEKMCRLSGDEKKIINTVADDWATHSNRPSECLLEWAVRGRADHPDLMDFLEFVIRDGNYSDLHSGNIMLDSDGRYRLIDLEGFYHTPLSHHKNRWFQCAPETSSQLVSSFAP